MTRSALDAGGNRAARAVRYAVVGLGYIAQGAVLPAFAHARKNSRLTALISDDPTKLRQLGAKYGIGNVFSYDQYDQALESGEFDAIYIALPNSMHAEYAVRAARAGIHVLCEKPMATTVAECRSMIAAARESGVKLMIAYRLHFDAANLEAIRIGQSGKLGEARFISSAFTMNVRAGDIRLSAKLGGGPLWDLGVYCINAARYLFRAEPIEARAIEVTGEDARFREVPESVCATLRFPDDRFSTFICSFNAADISTYRIVGTRGQLILDPAYDYSVGLKHHLKIGDKKSEKAFGKRDQFAPELIRFSDCVLGRGTISPTGEEGIADVRVMLAIEKAARTGRAVRIEPEAPPKRPSRSQRMHKPPVARRELVHATPPSKE